MDVESSQSYICLLSVLKRNLFPVLYYENYSNILARTMKAMNTNDIETLSFDCLGVVTFCLNET
jgi:hypothetical protein